MSYDLDLHCLHSLDVFTEKPYSKPRGRNVVYIPITASSHAMSMTVKIYHDGSLQSDRMSATL